MDLMTLVGLVGGAAVIGYGVFEGHSLSSFVNAHGVLLVLGGTSFAVMVNSSAGELADALRAGVALLRRSALPTPEEAIGRLVKLAHKARAQGALALRDEAKGDRILARALQVCLTSPDLVTARDILVRDINNLKARHREVGNIFRTMGLLAPMFGLLGTLIGIVSVLRTMSDPKSVGPAMALALSSAFYGILLANLVCVPAAGKLRSRSLQEAFLQELVMEGVLAIVFTNEMPLFVHTRLQSFLKTGPAPSPAAAPPVLPPKG
jgi:chemotaxis protein MotA